MGKPQATTAKVGMSNKIGINPRDLLARALKNKYHRKSILTLPDEIARNHQDKYFVYVPFTDFEKNGGFHPSGYQLFRTEHDSESVKDTKFNFANDGLIHRNEMVLAWIPKEEYEEREMERMVLNRSKDFEKYFDKDPSMRGFSPSVKETVETVTEEALKSSLADLSAAN